jgi:uncharacterized phage-associated protein
MRTIPVTNYLLRTAYREKKDDDLTPVRVEKLLYFLHGWYSVVTGTPLLDEPFVKGKYGPKLSSLDGELARFKGIPVDDYIQEWNPDTGKVGPLFVNPEAFPQFPKVLEKVWEQYSPYSTPQLSSMSHGANSAWAQTPAGGAAILQELIVEEFTRRAVASRSASARQ